MKMCIDIGISQADKKDAGAEDICSRPLGETIAQLKRAHFPSPHFISLLRIRPLWDVITLSFTHD